MNEILVYSLCGAVGLLILLFIIMLYRKSLALEKKNIELSGQNMQLVQDNAKLTRDLDHEKKRFEESKEIRERLTLEFKNLSTEIIKEQKKDFGEVQKTTFEAHFNPLKTEIQNFRQQMEKMKDDQIVGRASLTEQLKLFKEMNLSLQKEASELANALKGNKKMQGNWGEIQLERLFEITGFQEGIDYEKQVLFKTTDGRSIPDYILTLPDSRRVIIDSKVSLNNYVNYVNAEDLHEKERYLRAYVTDIRSHTKRLSDKEYANKLKEESLDFVFMFMPLEHAYIEALSQDPLIHQDAFESNIAITTPSSLLPILRTIEILWKVEKRHKNVEKIADLGGQLYDKLVNFSESMLSIGSHLQRAQNSYDEAIKRLKDGRGNAIQTAENLRALGAKTSKHLPSSLLDESTSSALTDHTL